MTSVDQLAARYWDLYLGANPSFASLVGDHRFDDSVEDMSDDFIDSHTARLRALRAELEPTDDDPVTQSLLLAVIDQDLTEYETEILVGVPDSYLGPHSVILRRAAQTSAPQPADAGSLAERYRLIPRLLTQALDRHRRHLAEGKTPVAINVTRVIDQIDKYVASPLSSDPFVGLQLPAGWEGADAWRTAMTSTVTDVIRPAYTTYRDGLHDEILPHARPSEQAGICHIPGGEEIYRRLVERFVTAPWDPAEIHNIGVTHATETLAAEYAETGADAFGLTKPSAIFERLRTEPSLRYQTEEEMLEHAEQIVARAWAAIDGWLGARPDEPCQVLPVPATLAKDMPPAYYVLPAPDGSRPGTYFLNTFEPQTRDRFASEAVAFHEAIPGHHFDRALAAELTDLPAFRRLRSHNAHAEGWGLYSERLADEMGLYSGPTDRLGMLSADSWRAGRLVVDTGIHFHGWSRDKAVQFLRDWTAINHPTIDQEIDRYIGWPGQALSYKMGQIEILRLRARAETEMGSAFDLVGFHDTLLTSGGVTLPVLADLVERWIESRQPPAGARAR
ncbi:MAG: DUF885 domain-containing protein [Acidimicrobiia bacterium]